MFDVPKISCLTVTNNRPEMLRRAIDCYDRQTYPNKELVILSQSDSEVKQIAESRQDILFVRSIGEKSLGALRNLTIELATGPILCQWDDDDVYHPYRLATQFKALNAHQAVASAYTQFLKYFQGENKAYWADWSQEMQMSHRYLPGTIMFRRNAASRFGGFFYPESGDQSKKEEDLNVLEKLIRVGWVAPVMEGHQYMYVHHGENVYDDRHHRLALTKIVLDVDVLRDKATLIEQTTAALGSIKVCSLTEEAFCTKGIS